MTAPTATTGAPARHDFHALTVTAATPAADDHSAVAVTFHVPAPLRATFAFAPGQYVTLRAHREGAEVRRAYSLCSTPRQLDADGTLRIGVRTVDGGRLSPYLARELAPGDTLDVLAPQGHFTTPLDPGHHRRHYAALAAGSGITPVLSLAATALATEPTSTFTVVYANRSAASAMFTEELADLKDRYGRRLHLLRLFSRETHHIGLPHQRLDAPTLRTLLAGPLPAAVVDTWFLCGPQAMVGGARDVLAEQGVAAATIHAELFHTQPDTPPAPADGTRAPHPGAELTLRHGGHTSTVPVEPGQTLLDAGLAHRPELPFSCLNGVCATCRARVVGGRAEMASNWTLTEEEIADNYILTCQASPLTPTVDLDYDVV
ncbi:MULTISPECIES: 2Fe-2S iron-sulfur cluster-binding protein [Streptomyces]|uniref:2Fe-2S iron-sulfur cluster-binding protein n=1 Tax=Streptomyces TaxID=1883 RepID=UPI00069A9EB7|nr:MULTISPECIES: 2Fe-2S iron-sulfur cluster-binding protein [Streptomyces]MYU56634.1 2Fe-2S iron-sulfur cluster binding domain-containing protein [Streptomyces sp. SID7805]